MGTSGVRIFKFRGRYWIYHNHYDSYFEGMGDSLVRTIPTDTDGYQKWLLAQREFFNKWNTLLETMLCIQPEKLLKLDTEESYTPPWQEAFDERMHEEPTHIPESPAYIEYMYLLELDLEVFSVDNCAHYRLDKIPSNGEWMRAIFEDDEGYRFVHPQLAPPESLADLTIPNSDFSTNALAMWDLLEKREVTPKSPYQSVISRVRWEIFKIFQRTQKDQLSVNLLGWTANSLPFREIIFFILCVAAGGKNVAVVDKRRILEPYNRELYRAMISGYKPDGDRELISSVGAGYHMQDQPVGSSPNASKYWLEGVLVCLVPRLDQPGVLQRGLADAIQHGRGESPCTTFNGLLVSIEHLVLFRSFPNRRVEYSPLMSLISIGFHRSMNAQQRYGSDWLDEFDTQNSGDESSGEPVSSQGTEAGQKDLASPITTTTPDVQGPPDSVELAADSGPNCNLENDNGAANDARITDNENSLEELEAPARNIKRDEEVWTVRKTFLSLVNFFESTALDQLKPTGDNGGKLPIEIITIILSSVSDTETYNACRKVSRGYRSICDQRPLLMDDVVLRGHPFDSPANPREMDTYTSEYNSNFHALEISTGRRMEFKVIFSYRSLDTTDCLVVIGSDWNRKSFATNCPISFEGLELSAPWEDKTTTTWIDRYRYLQRPDQPMSAMWDQAFKYRLIGPDSTSESLGEFWEMATRSLLGVTGGRRGTGLRSQMNLPWLMPPNTSQYVASADHYFHEEAFHVLYVRLKRTSKYCNTLWGDLIREAKESLESGDEYIVFKKVHREASEQKYRVLGADSPFVMLIVGFEVRLFEWKHGAKELDVEYGSKKPSPSGVLREFEPGRVYMVDDTAGREAIERFLHMVAEKLKTFGPRGD